MLNQNEELVTRNGQVMMTDNEYKEIRESEDKKIDSAVTESIILDEFEFAQSINSITQSSEDDNFEDVNNGVIEESSSEDVDREHTFETEDKLTVTSEIEELLNELEYEENNPVENGRYKGIFKTVKLGYGGQKMTQRIETTFEIIDDSLNLRKAYVNYYFSDNPVCKKMSLKNLKKFLAVYDLKLEATDLNSIVSMCEKLIGLEFPILKTTKNGYDNFEVITDGDEQ